MRIRLIVAVLLLIVTGMAFTGCGGGSSDHSPLGANERFHSLGYNSVVTTPDVLTPLFLPDGPAPDDKQYFEQEWDVIGTGFSTIPGTYRVHVETADGSQRSIETIPEPRTDTHLVIHAHIPILYLPPYNPPSGETRRIRVVLTKGGVPLPVDGDGDIFAFTVIE